MNYYFSPVNLKQWNMFEEVKNVGHIESFLATKEMNIGDIMILHVGNQDKSKQLGVYAYGVIINAPYILEDRPQDYGNNKLCVDVEIKYISYDKPIIATSEHKIFKQYRTVHKLDDETACKLERLIGKYFLLKC